MTTEKGPITVTLMTCDYKNLDYACEVLNGPFAVADVKIKGVRDGDNRINLHSHIEAKADHAPVLLSVESTQQRINQMASEIVLEMINRAQTVPFNPSKPDDRHDTLDLVTD